MQHKPRFILLSLIFVLLFSTMTSCNITKRQMVITMIQGHPEIQQKGSSEWTAITEGMVVEPGDYMRTGINEYIWMEINDGSYFGLGKETEAGITTLSRSFTDPVTLIDLKDGMVFVTVTKSLGKGSFEVYTPIITAGVVGSKMAVDYDKTKSTADVACLEGTVTGKYGDDTASPQVDSGYILGLSVGTIENGFNADIYKARPADEVYNEFNWFDSRYRNPLWGTEDLSRTQESKLETQRVETFRMIDIIKSYTPTPQDTETPIPTDQPTQTPNPNHLIRPTITVGADQPLSPEEQASVGVHDYSVSSTYSGNCTGPAVGHLQQVSILFTGNQVTMTNGNLKSVYSKVDENTYQGVDPSGDVVTFMFTSDGFSGGYPGCYQGEYIRE